MNNRIKEVRKANKLSQAEFAEKLGLTQNYISLVEGGQREISDRTAKDICREFKVNEEWLRTGSGEMYNPPDDETIAAIADMLDDPEDSVVQFIASFFKAYKSLDDKSQTIIRDQINTAAAHISACKKDQD